MGGHPVPPLNIYTNMESVFTFREESEGERG
jgi:hypothetical protein